MNKSESVKLGFMGECYVMLELVRRGIMCQKMDDCMDFDLTTEFGETIEVKTSRPLRFIDKRPKHKKKPYYDSYQFTNHAKVWKKKEGIKGYQRESYKKRDRVCNFFVFVCLNKDLTVHKYYIIPKEVIGDKPTITIPIERKVLRKGQPDTEQYKGAWGSIKGIKLTDNQNKANERRRK